MLSQIEGKKFETWPYHMGLVLKEKGRRYGVYLKGKGRR